MREKSNIQNVKMLASTWPNLRDLPGRGPTRLKNTVSSWNRVVNSRHGECPPDKQTKQT